jgi:molybdopterin synthase sulfur carrier subunit
MVTVTLRYWAAAKEAAGVAEQIVTADTLAAALTLAPAALPGPRPPGRLEAVLARSSFLIDGAPVGQRAADTVQLANGNVIEVLPPFAGG